MKQFTSGSELKGLSSFLVPGRYEALGYIVVAFLSLCALNFGRFWHLASEGMPLTREGFGHAFGESALKAGDALNSGVAGDIVVFLLWGMLGCVLYIAFWLTQNSLSGLTQDASADVIGGKQATKNFLQSKVAHFLFFVTLSFSTVLGLYIFVWLITPALAKIFYNAIINVSPFNPTSVAMGLVAVVLLAVVLHLLTLLIRIYTRFWSIYIRP